MNTHLYVTLVNLQRWTTAPTRRGMNLQQDQKHQNTQNLTQIHTRKNALKYSQKQNKTIKQYKTKPQKKMPTNHSAETRSRGV